MTYLNLSRHGIYYFRLVVPQAYRASLGRSELRKSLRTRSHREALLRAAQALVEARKVIPVSSDEVHTISFEVQTLTRTPNESIPKLSELVESYAHEQRLEGVSEKTIDDKRAVVSLMVRIVGDLPIDQYHIRQAKSFREVALKLPPMVSRIKGKSIQQIVEEAEQTISLTTFNNYVKNLSSLFGYAVREQYTKENPFTSLKIRQRGSVSRFRNVLELDEVKAIFDATRAYRDSSKPWKYWLPRLGYYTGGRLLELCQLYRKDVVEVNGLWCIHVQATMPDQRLKTDGSERLIPLHPELIGLGFIEYLQGLPSNQHMVFNLIAHKTHSYSAAPSKWFGRLRDQLALVSDSGKKDFHSFRHTVADQLKQKGVSENATGGLLGHATGGITYSRYGKAFKPEALVKAVEAISTVKE